MAAPVGFGSAAGAFVTRFADPLLLESRIRQLESGRLPRSVPVAPGRIAVTVVGAVAFLTAVAGAWAFMLLTCPCGMGIIALRG